MSKVKIEDAIVFELQQPTIKELYEAASQDDNPTIGVRRGMLQRKLQIIEWRKNERARAKNYIHSLIKGTADSDSLMFVPIELVLNSLYHKLNMAVDKSSKESIQKTIDEVKQDIDDGIQIYLLDGQNRTFEAILPFRNNEFELSKKPLIAIVNGKKEVLSGKKYKNLSKDVQEFFDNIKVYAHTAQQGDIDTFIDALIAKNSNVGWIEWQRLCSQNTFTEFRKQIEQVFNNDEDNLIADKVLSHIDNAEYQMEKDGYEKLISELLIWMVTGTQPKLKSTNMQSLFFKGEDGMIVPNSLVNKLRKYLREFAQANVKSKSITHILVRNYVMFRFALDSRKSDRFKNILLPYWNIEKNTAFVSEYVLACARLHKDPQAHVVVYFKNPDGTDDTTRKPAKRDKVPGYFPYATSDYKPELLTDRIRLISEELLKSEEDLVKENIITVLDETKSPSVEDIANSNGRVDYKNRKLFAKAIVSNTKNPLQGGHKKPKIKGGSNVDLELQPQKSNASYGATPL